MPIVRFPNKTLEIGMRQAQLLVEKGQIHKAPDGFFDGEDAELALITMIEAPEAMTCDFCGGTPVHWEYPAEDFLMAAAGSEVQESIGAWMACDACAPYINNADRPGLTDRAIRCYIERHPTDVMEVPVQLALELAFKGLHESFFDHLKGPGVRI